MNPDKKAYIDRLSRLYHVAYLHDDPDATTLDGLYSGKSSRIVRLIRKAYHRGIRRGIGLAWEARQKVTLRREEDSTSHGRGEARSGWVDPAIHNDLREHVRDLEHRIEQLQATQPGADMVVGRDFMLALLEYIIDRTDGSAEHLETVSLFYSHLKNKETESMALVERLALASKAKLSDLTLLGFALGELSESEAFGDDPLGFFRRIAWGIVQNAQPKPGLIQRRWVVVRDACGIGSTQAKRLCVMFDADPAERLGDLNKSPEGDDDSE